MSPRRYDMRRRQAERERTRERIVDATLRLHGERGIFGTTWRDIAREADVAVATVYAHFPTLDELVPACGASLMERLRPPTAEDVASVVVGSSVRERAEGAARHLFAFYDRGGSHLESDLRERRLPAVAAWEAELAAVVDAFARRALGRSDADSARTLAALLDRGTFLALARRGHTPESAAVVVAELIEPLVATSRPARREAPG